MDELTIGDKIYISSKQAAKITGYAKDYVGQLCREGRVEAKLVGRNWYVLESSIQEHRFGKEESEKEEQPSHTAGMGPERSWSIPVYHAEPAVTIPPVISSTERTKVDIFSIHKSDIQANAVSDMQDAWKEWFDQKREAKKGDSDIADDEIEEDEEDAEDDMEEDSIETYTETEEDRLEINIERTTEDSREEESDQEADAAEDSALSEEEEGETVSIHRSYRRPPAPISELPEAVFSMPAPRYSDEVRRKTRKKASSSTLVLRSLFFFVAVMAIVVGAIGTGLADRFSTHGGYEQKVIDYLGGVTVYKNTSK